MLQSYSDLSYRNLLDEKNNVFIIFYSILLVMQQFSKIKRKILYNKHNIQKYDNFSVSQKTNIFWVSRFIFLAVCWWIKLLFRKLFFQSTIIFELQKSKCKSLGSLTLFHEKSCSLMAHSIDFGARPNCHGTERMCLTSVHLNFPIWKGKLYLLLDRAVVRFLIISIL